MRALRGQHRFLGRLRPRCRPSPVVVAVLAAAAGWLSGAEDARAQLSANFTVSPSYISGVSQPTDIAFTPDGRAVVTLRGGSVRVRQTNGTLVTINGAFPGLNTAPGEQGLLGVVADPDFASNQRLYFYASDGGSNASRHRIRRATLSESNVLTVEATPFLEGGLRSSDGVSFGNHNGGGMAIHQGDLYIGVGDSGFNATPAVNKFGSCLNVANGKILRVQLSNGQPPASNPLTALGAVTGCSDTANPTMGTFVDNAAPDPRIYAWGFRNPWRLWVDPNTGMLWVGDVGEMTREEISVGPGGRHYGYPFHEGTVDYTNLGRDCGDVTPQGACIEPALDYPRADGDCVIGGVIPEGCGWAQATGGQTLYFFGDHGTGSLWTVQVNSGRTGITGGKQLFGTYSGISSIRQGVDDALYVVREGGNAVTRIMPNACSTGTGGTSGSGGSGSGGSGAGGSGAGGTSGSGGSGTGGRGTGGAGGSGSGGSGVGGASGGRGGAGGTGGAGGVAGTGGAAGRGAGSGGAAGGSGGAATGSGGAATGSGGAATGSGGAATGSGGAATGSGGAAAGSGGRTGGTGGSTGASGGRAGGSGGSAGGAGTGATDGGSGCGCAVPGGGMAAPLAELAALLLALAARGRRGRGRRRSR